MDDILLNVGGKEFYFDIDKLAKEVGYIPMSQKDYAQRLESFKSSLKTKG